jgi:ribosomal protein S18 acetylase RimI-like enzyme
MLRKADARDLNFIQGLAELVFAQFGDYRNILTEYFESPYVTTFIYDEDSAPAAFAMVSILFDTEAWFYTADLLAIAVKPEFQAQGIGGQLLDELCEWSRKKNAEKMRLSVAETNHRAKRFFTHKGFRIVVENEGHYPAGQRSHAMEKNL